METTISFFYFILFALVSEEPSPQCMCNVCTIRQHVSSSRDGTGPEPLTRDPIRPDPDAFWPGDQTRSLSVVLWIEIILMTLCYKWMLSAKSLVYAAHTQMTKMSNIIYCKFIQCWKVKTRNSAVADKPRNAFRGQSYVRYGFLSVCYSNIVPKMRRFSDIQLQKMSWRWNSGQRSLKVIESGTIR